jgi:hypothetical protein
MGRPLPGKVLEIPDEKLEERYRESNPPVLYKYRNWTSEYHKDSLRRSQIWFSSPKQLNDLHDIRLAYTFNTEEVYSQEFFYKLRKEFPNMTRLLPGTRDFEIALQNRYDLIRSNPEKWFHDNQVSLREGDTYERLGLFSTTIDPLSKTMWAYYGDSHFGYCIGYDPFSILKSKPAFCGEAHYLKEPIQYSFLRKEHSFDFIDLFIKDQIWAHEKEYRFVTFIENDSERLVTLNVSAVKEVILGRNTSKISEGEIIESLKGKYHSQVKLFKIQEGLGSSLILRSIPY